MVLVKMKMWLSLMRGCIQAKVEFGSGKRKGCSFGRCVGMVLADERSGPGRCEEWSWQMRGVVLEDQRSGPGR